jgi:hypothetical protein
MLTPTRKEEKRANRVRTIMNICCERGKVERARGGDAIAASAAPSWWLATYWFGVEVGFPPRKKYHK